MSFWGKEGVVSLVRPRASCFETSIKDPHYEKSGLSPRLHQTKCHTTCLAIVLRYKLQFFRCRSRCERKKSVLLSATRVDGGNATFFFSSNIAQCNTHISCNLPYTISCSCFPSFVLKAATKQANSMVTKINLGMEQCSIPVLTASTYFATRYI